MVVCHWEKASKFGNRERFEIYLKDSSCLSHSGMPLREAKVYDILLSFQESLVFQFLAKLIS